MTVLFILLLIDQSLKVNTTLTHSCSSEGNSAPLWNITFQSTIFTKPLLQRNDMPPICMLSCRAHATAELNIIGGHESPVINYKYTVPPCR